MSLTALATLILLGGRQATPQATLNAFVGAWNAKNLKRAATWVVGGKPNADYGAIKGQALGWPTITLSGLRVETKGDQAKAFYRLAMAGIGGKTSLPPRDESAQLVKTGGKWLIVPAQLQDGNRAYLPSMAALMARPEAFTQARQAAKTTACLSNVKQLSTGLLMLAADNKDVFRATPGNVKNAIAPYIKNNRLWQCPSAPAGTTSYSFNGNLSNKSQAALADPSRVVLIYEGANGKLAFRHEGRAAVAFADGHAKLIKAADAKSLIWKP